MTSSSLTIEKKLFLGVGALVLFTFALGITALVNVSSIGDRVAVIVGPTIHKKTLAHRMSTDAAELVSLDRAILVRGYMKDTGTMGQYNQQFGTTIDAMQKDIDTIRPLLITQIGKASTKEIQDSISGMQQASQAVYQAALAGNMDAAVATETDTLLPIQKRVQDNTAILLKACDDLFGTQESAAESSISSTRWITALMLILTCCVVVAVFFVVQQINAHLRHSVSELAESAVQIASAAGQVSTSSQSLAQGSSEQAATIEETSSASTEINSMAHRNTENSKSAAEGVTRSAEGFEKTNLSLTEMVEAMDGINASSQKISKIIKVIDDIAFQTNILALNAAVEAARAGEAGMGFAVVAEEVRNLAQRSAQAAKDTADLIEESIDRSNSGKLKVDQVAQAIKTITADAQQIKVLVDEINLGSIEQTRGIEQITNSISQMEQVTQSNAASAEESAAAAEQLNAQADAMRDIVKSLRQMVDGDMGDSNGESSADQSLHFTAKAPSRKLAPGLLAKAAPLVKAASLAKTVTRIKSAVKMPTMQSVAPVSAKAVAAASFPMDDDFKEF